jgi:alkylation response protein AidB-like acyl-CoA dehydrogenase
VTRATRDGGDFVVNGSRSVRQARISALDHMARTDRRAQAPRHLYFLLDMKTPGIQVQPLRNMADDAGSARSSSTACACQREPGR